MDVGVLNEKRQQVDEQRSIDAACEQECVTS